MLVPKGGLRAVCLKAGIHRNSDTRLQAYSTHAFFMHGHAQSLRQCVCLAAPCFLAHACACAHIYMRPRVPACACACSCVRAQEGLANESQLQTWFVSRITRWLALVHGRTAVAWDEVRAWGLVLIIRSYHACGVHACGVARLLYGQLRAVLAASSKGSNGTAAVAAAVAARVPVRAGAGDGRLAPRG